MQGPGFRVQGSGFRVQGAGFRIWAPSPGPATVWAVTPRGSDAGLRVGILGIEFRGSGCRLVASFRRRAYEVI